MIDLIKNLEESLLLCWYCLKEGNKTNTPKAIHLDLNTSPGWDTACCGNPKHCQGDKRE